jgi:hypothetical protein
VGRPLEDREALLADLLDSASYGIALNRHSGDGGVIFKHACALGCEGIASKRLGPAIAPAGSTIGSRLRIRRRQPQGARPRRIGEMGAAQGRKPTTDDTRSDTISPRPLNDAPLPATFFNGSRLVQVNRRHIGATEQHRPDRAVALAPGAKA